MEPGVDPFNVADIIPDFEARMAELEAASDATRRTHRSQIDLPYGPLPRNRLDLFFPRGELRGAPIHMFIHGGYWRGQVKEDYVFVADGAIAAGAIAAIVEYTLMPGARMAQLVAEVRSAAAWLAAHAHEFGGDGSALSASGHSAGAHLCSYLASRSPHEAALPAPHVKSLLMLSGIYDLRPITTSYLQPTLQLTAEEVAHWSPFEAVPSPDAHYEIAVGHAETEPFHIQAQDYAIALERREASVERVTLPDLDHMSLVRALGRPETAMGTLLTAAIERSRR
ncbi:MAG TPA: alpha/beta hydrolase [Devosia sp.]|nr:alpha/beta hydrolase [Devosia sp.]